MLNDSAEREPLSVAAWREFRPAHYDFSNPKEAADGIVRWHFSRLVGDSVVPTLRYRAGEFYLWDETRFRVHPVADLRELFYKIGKFAGKPLRKRHVEDVLDALRAVTNLSDVAEAPFWIDMPSDALDPACIIPMQNGLLDVSARKLIAPTPLYFTTHAVPYSYDPDAPEPVRWLAFLRDLWGEDIDSPRLLRMWFAYCLLPRTEQQKILLLVGPGRSGKGTIVRVLRELLGRANSVSPTLGSLAQPFGLAPLIGKLLAVVSDVRLSGRLDIATVVENLLRISGEDAVTIPRKYLADYTDTLKTRLMLVSNELPWFTDGSGAIASRFMALQTSRSFLDNEDVRLTDALLEELPAIFLWALDGLDDLQETGRFVQPKAGADVRNELAQLAAPVRAFLDAECEVADPAAEIACADLFAAWNAWCEANGYRNSGNSQTFGRDLRAVFPSLRVVQHRVTGNANPVRHYCGIRLKQRGDTQ